ncbi:TonB-dependent receptor [Mangrovibacterium diazotrophicum]|uniref:Iron complex outermembrane receptor protein n=1 Tax=Mangrovibacterium diazotrophicum TaxID=1261403 RepID=A0A419W6B3_9BACT|nr:TonB-dependent receptor [Mangrovibacterium diazotrophicum]RKD91011.1 iron complex outermembrane receptor protein [Mangrovibacterium diazotrophicum]
MKRITCQAAVQLLLALILHLNLSAQKTGTIQGKVVTSDEQKAAFVNVFIPGTTYGTTTNNDGIFTLRGVPAGQQEISFSLIGLETKTVKLDVNENQLTDAGTIVLTEKLSVLEEAVVVANRLNQFAAKSTEYVAGIPLKNIDNPQSYSSITGALMEEQMVTDLTDAMKSITGGGGYVKSNEGNISVYLRGFRSDAYVKDGMLSFVRVPVDPQNVERMEIIKGPSAVMYGSANNNVSSYGGVLNRVSKKPMEHKSMELSYSTGSWELNRLTADINSPLDSAGKALFRVNGAYHSENSFKDAGMQRDYLFAPSLTYQFNDKLKISLLTEFFHTKRTLTFANGVANTVTAKTWNDLAWDYDKSYWSNAMAGEMSSKTVTGFVEYQISPRIKSTTGLSTAEIDVEANFLRLYFTSDTTVQPWVLQYMPRTAGSIHAKQEFSGDFDLGKLNNKFLAGASYVRVYDRYQRNTGTWIRYDVVDMTTGTSPTYSPDAHQQLADAAGITATRTSYDTYSAYLSDAISFNDYVTFLGGIRYDRNSLDNTFTNGVEGTNGYDLNAFSYKAGLVISPVKDQVSVFGNYMNGYNLVSPGADNTGEQIDWDPEYAKQWEVGTKIDLFEKKLMSTISYYHINIENQVITSNGEQFQNGTNTTSKGVEVELIANPIPGLNFVSGYTHNKAYYDETPEYRMTYSPENLFNFWGSYRVMKGDLKGLGCGLGLNYASETFVNTTNTFGSEAYTVADATVFYDLPKIRFSLKVDNLSDKQYYNPYGQAQKPRNFKIGITYQL